jgi:GTP-binding protein
MLESIAIIGKPNVGKSSLFNKLTSSRKSIVSDFPGLTRDRNYSFISIKNKKFFLVDTGGIGNIDGFSGKVSQQAWQAAEE